MGVDAHFSDLQNRVAAGIFQRFQNTNQCSAGIGAAPQQAESPHFHLRRNEDFSHLYYGCIACYNMFDPTSSARIKRCGGLIPKLQ